MASVLKHLRSSTADKRPTASGLADGQLAINTASGTPGLYFEDSAGNIVKVGPAHVGTAAPNASPAGSTGNSKGELWVDENTTTPGLKYYNGSSFVNLTPSGTQTTVGLVELATDAETQAGTDTVRAVTPSGLQSKISDSTSTTSSTTIASATAVKNTYDLANAALPKTGGTVTGAVVISPSGSLSFEGTTDDAFETTISAVDPTADRTFFIPNITGTGITTSDTGTVTNGMLAGSIADSKLNTISTANKVSLSSLNIDGGTDIGAALADADLFIVDDGGAGTNRKAAATRITDYAFGKVSGDVTISSSGLATISELPVSKLQDGSARQLLQTDAAGTGVEWTSNVDVPGTLDVTSTATFDSSVTIASGLTVDTNTLFVDAANNRVAIGTNSTSIIDTKGFIANALISKDLNSGLVLQTSASGASSEALTFYNDYINTDFKLTVSHLNIGGVGNVAQASFGGTGLDSVVFSADTSLNGTGFTVQDFDTITLKTDLVYINDQSGINMVTFDVADKITTFYSSSTSYEQLQLNSTGANGTQMTFVVGGSYIGGIGSSKWWDGTGTLSNQNVGIASNNDLDFLTNQVFRARITAAGNFGINDPAPDAKFTVSGVSSFGAGTAAAPGIAARGDLDTGIWFPAANTVAISTAGSERLRILSTGGVRFPGATSGTITVSPTAVAGTTTITLPATTGTVVTTGDSGTVTSTMIANNTILNADVNDSAAIAGTKISPDFGSQSTTTTGLSTAASFIPSLTLAVPTQGMYEAGTNSIGLSTNSLERLRIDSSGRLLVGTSASIQVPLSSSTLGDPSKQIAGTSQPGATSAQYVFSTNANIAPNLIFARSRGTTVGTQGLVSDGDSLGRVVFEGSDGQAIGTNAGFIRAAVIEGQVDGTASAGDMPGRLVLSTTADGAATPTERLRITNDGVCAYNQAAPAAIDTSATATITNLKTGLITSSTAAAVTITLPTGTNCDGGFSGIYTNLTFEWSVINTGATNAVTIVGNTGHTIVGSATVAASNSGRFASRRTAANTWVSYRLSS